MDKTDSELETKRDKETSKGKINRRGQCYHPSLTF